jgi:hypothetical protein
VKILYQLPDPLIIFTFVLVLLAIAWVLIWVVRWIPSWASNSDHFDFVYKSQGPVGLLCIMVLSLSLVAAQGNLRAVENLQIKEVAAINNLDLELARLGTDDGIRLRVALKHYVSSIINDDWPAMTHGTGSDLTQEALNPVLVGVEMLDKGAGSQRQASSGLIKSAEALAQLRDERLETAALTLSPTFWLATGSLIFIYLLFFALMPMNRFQLFVAYLQIASFGILVGVVFVTDQPYLGQTSIHSERFTKLQAVMESRKAWVFNDKRR